VTKVLNVDAAGGCGWAWWDVQCGGEGVGLTAARPGATFKRTLRLNAHLIPGRRP